jgi:hypothetical protein
MHSNPLGSIASLTISSPRQVLSQPQSRITRVASIEHQTMALDPEHTEAML